MRFLLLSLALLLVTSVNGQGMQAFTTNPGFAAPTANTLAGFPQMGMPNTMGNNFGFQNAQRALTMSLAQAQIAPSVEDICMATSMRPGAGTGMLSDVVGNEIAKRAAFLRTFPQMAGTGKWGCAASFYATRNPPSELGNAFGDLIDSTGCNRFTCDPLNGPMPIRGGLMGTLMMGSLMNSMGMGNMGMGNMGMGNMGMGMGMGRPMGQMGQMGQQMGQPMGQPRAAKPVMGRPQAPIMGPAAPPAAPAQPIQPVQQAQPAYNPPAQQQPRISNADLAHALSQPMFQQQLMAILTKMLGNPAAAKG